jgi:hypothetical protein
MRSGAGKRLLRTWLRLFPGAEQLIFFASCLAELNLQ